MKITSAILIGFIALLLGFFFRAANVPPDKTTGGPALGAAPSSRSRTAGISRQRVEETIRISDSTDRWLRTVALLEKASLGDMLGIAQSIGFSDDRISNMVAHRWFELSPSHFFETCLAEMKRTPSGESASFGCYDFIEFLADEWPKQDFEAALTAFSQPDPKEYLGDAKGQLVNLLAKTDLDKAIELYFSLGEGFWSNGLGNLRESARHNPRKVARIVFKHFDTHDSDRFGPPGSQLIEALAEGWGENDPAAALAFASSHQNDQGKYLRTKIIETWLADDRIAASTWLEEQPPDVQEKHRPALVKSWATEDPKSALAWCLENLPDPETRMETARSLFDGAITKDIAETAALIPELDDLNLKWIAVSKITKEWFKPDENHEIRPAAIAWLRSLNNSPTAQAVMKDAMETWAKTDPDSMKSFLEEERAFDYPTEAYQQIVTALTNRDPIEALEWSVGLGEHSQSTLSTASQIWLTKRPEAAINWLRSSPAQPAAEAAIEALIEEEIKHPQNLLQRLDPENKAWLEAKFGK